MAISVQARAGKPPARWVHVCPPSIDLYTPTGSAACGCPLAAAPAGLNPPAGAMPAYRTFVSLGSMTIREKHRPAKLPDPSTDQVAPPSVDLRMPTPGRLWKAKLASPVPA